MKHLISLMVALCLFAQIGQAQKIITSKDYEVISDHISALVKLAEEDSVTYTIVLPRRAPRSGKTIDQYMAIQNNINSLVKLAEKDSSSYVGMSFSEFVNQLDKLGLKIAQVGVMRYPNCKEMHPEHVCGITLWFTPEDWRTEHLLVPNIKVHFAESKPYERALDLERQYRTVFNEEIAAFYSDAIIESLFFHLLKDN